MIVCHCRCVTDRAIRRAVSKGAASAAEIGLACAAGSDCGGCKPAIEQIIATERRTAAPPLTPLALAAAG